MTTTWTVVVPTFDRPVELLGCLEALQALESAPGMKVEVLVIDDGGRRGAQETADLVSGRYPIRVHRQTNAGPAAARNVGAAKAAGSRIAFTDDDCRPTRTWLRTLDAALDTAPDALVGGRTVNALAANGWAEASQRVVDHVVANTPGGFLPSCNLAVDREGFLAAGGFDERFPHAAGEDRALCDQWRAAGRRILLVDGAVVGHEHHLRPRSFWRQHAGYGRAAWTIHRTADGSRPGAPTAYAELIAGPLRDAVTPHTIAMSARIVVSQLATACGWVQGAARDRVAR